MIYRKGCGCRKAIDFVSHDRYIKVKVLIGDLLESLFLPTDCCNVSFDMERLSMIILRREKSDTI